MKSKYYNGNKNLYKQGTRQEFTKEQIEEVIKCRDDIEYFAEKYVYIVNPLEGRQLIKLYDSQKEDFHEIDVFKEKNIRRKRNSGKTTSLIIYILHYMLYNNDKSVAIIGPKEAIAKNILGRIKKIYEDLPLWMKHGVKVWNKGRVELENGTIIIISSANSYNLMVWNLSLLAIDDADNIQHIKDTIYDSIYPVMRTKREYKIITT